MKEYDKNIDERIGDTMRLLDSLPTLKASPQFRVRVMERIDIVHRKQFNSGTVPGSFNFRLALGALLIAVNIGSATMFIMSSKSVNLARTTDTIEQIMNDDYNGQELAYYVETPETQTDTNETEEEQAEK